MTEVEIVSQICEIAGLPYNWDGGHAEPIPEVACYNAGRIAKLFKGAELIKITPTAKQSITLKFQNDDTYLEIEVFQSRYVTTVAGRDEDGTFTEMFPEPEPPCMMCGEY